MSKVESYAVQKVKGKNGHLTLLMNGLHLHSKYNPIVEAEKIAKKNYEMHHTHIIFGYGLGYIVDALLEELNNEKIIVIDPLVRDGDLIMKEEHLQSEKVVYWDRNNINTLAFTLNQIADRLDRKIKIICSPNYDKLFIEEYHDLLRYLRDSQKKSQLNLNTVVLLADKWQQNLTENILSIYEDESLSSLYSYFDVPIVIASGGPSLTKQLPLLKKIQDKVVIITAGTTINSLLAANIEPDFVVSIDGSDINYNHFKDIKLHKSRLIYSMFNHPGVKKSFSNSSYSFLASNLIEIAKYMLKKFDVDLPLIAGGATVAHYCYIIAQLISTGPIAFIGQDLAYTNNKTHAENNKGIMTKDEASKKYKEEFFSVEGYYGEEIFIPTSFISMKRTFEELMRFYKPNVPVFNCTEGGVKLIGYEQLPFKQFINYHISDDLVKKEIVVKKTGENKIDVKEIFEEEIIILNKLIKMATEALAIISNNNSQTVFEQKSLNKLEEIDEKIAELSKDVQIQFLLEPITIEIETLFLEKPNETVMEKYRRISQQNKTLYKKLIDMYTKSKLNIRETLKLVEEGGQNNG